MHRRFLKGEPLQTYIPQSSNLSLISTGDQYAVGDKGWLCLEVGALLMGVSQQITLRMKRIITTCYVVRH